jgi:3-dehydroquinate dehydratase-2
VEIIAAKIQKTTINHVSLPNAQSPIPIPLFFISLPENHSVKLLIINGPNLNLLGQRETDLYGSQSFESYLKKLRREFHEIQIEYYQSNVEGEIINALHNAGFLYDGIIINAGGYTHTSVAIADAIKAIRTPVVEVHISNTFAREPFRHTSYLAANVKGSIIGFGMESYHLAIRSFLPGIG